MRQPEPCSEDLPGEFSNRVFYCAPANSDFTRASRPKEWCGTALCERLRRLKKELVWKNSANFPKKDGFKFFNIALKIMTSELLSKIGQDVKEAMKQKDALRLSVLRMVLSVAHNKAKDKKTKGGEEVLTEEESLAVLRSEVKKRKDAIGEFTKGGRKDLADKESAELLILEKYLPAEISDEALEKIVGEVIVSLGAVTMKDFGKIMSEIMKKTGGQASGDRVSQAVKSRLNHA